MEILSHYDTNFILDLGILIIFVDIAMLYG